MNKKTNIIIIDRRTNLPPDTWNGLYQTYILVLGISMKLPNTNN